MKHTPLLVAAAIGLAAPFSTAQETGLPRLSPAKQSARREAAEKAVNRLQNNWLEFAERNARGDFRADPAVMEIQPVPLAAPMLEAVQKEASPFPEPDVIRSGPDGRLVATLRISMALNKIGNQAVYLRNYNGKLVGPTLRCKPGDTLIIKLQNDLYQEPYIPGAMDTLHNFNTTNLHTHGLHVSPSGNSDNVLLSVNPGSVQNYEIAIPKDHPAGTFWYHAHLHGSTAANVGSGMSGALIIEGGLDTVPEIAAAPDRTFVFQQIPYVVIDSKDAFPPIPGKEKDNFKVGVVEAEFIDKSFGPGTWDALKGYTTINGVKLPIIRMKPGSVERWRFVGSSVREVIQPEIIRHGRSDPGAPYRIPMYEIATDGLALGRVAPRDNVELWPGYRSDVLVQAPPMPGSYVLHDMREVKEDPKKPNTVYSQERRRLALIVVEGEKKPMNLPTDEQVKGYRLPSIDPTTVTGREVAAYGILLKGNGVTFTIDRTSFGTDAARQMDIGEVHEWTVTSRNRVGPVSHPFHIHVNPFEIFSILDPEGAEQLDKDAKGNVLPVWRDTIILHEGFKISFRTQYTVFDGTYVNHCHILDHEDQGMMELVQIVKPAPAAGTASTVTSPVKPYAAPDWELPDATGNPRKLAALMDGPTMLVFFEGFGCLRCNEQIQSLVEQYEAFKKRGIQIVAVSTDTVDGLKEAMKDLSVPFPVVADPAKNVFRKYGCFAGEPLHGLFMLDGAAQVRWQNVSKTPYRDFERAVRESGLLSTAAIPAPISGQLATGK